MQMRLDSLFLEPPVSNEPSAQLWRDLDSISIDYLMQHDDFIIDPSVPIDTLSYDDIGYYTGQVIKG